MQAPVKVGVIGCGHISRAYFEIARTFSILDIVACADLYLERAQERAREFHIPKAYSVEELLADPEIELVINLTIPRAHAEIGRAALEAGKCVYNEKPLAISREEGRRMLEIAAARRLLVGSAPDTFLGGGLQTCRKVIDDGEIGEPIAASAFMLCHGHEHWHPDPAFYYQAGSGPMFDMGPYYLTALITLIGPVRHVTGSTKITFPERTITSEPRYGSKIQVETPTHVTGIIDFANGAIGTISTSFDVWATTLLPIEIYGTRGTLLVPDPNTFDGPVRVRRAGEGTWSDIPLSHGYTKNSRGIGVADMAYALRSGRPLRASGELAYHVLDSMCAFEEASQKGKHIELTSTCKRPEPLPIGLTEKILEE
ncbi:MAG: Gfo/Idh/MocA family protein [Ktedonobacteraceae bacterium]